MKHKASRHLKDIIVTAFNAGMRKGELRELKWKYVDKEKMVIRLPETATKEGSPKIIPINHHVKEVLDSIPRALNHNFVFTYK